MASYGERVNQIKVELVSPDRSVEATFDTRQGLAVRLEDRKLARHDDESLAAQIVAVIRGAGQGSRAAHEKIREERHGPRVPPELENEATAARRRQLQRQVDALHVARTSRNGWVRVELRGGDDVRVRIKPGTVGHPAVPADALAREINEVLAAAVREYAAHALKRQRGE